MPDSILVATPHAAFGELLRLSLEESGKYQVRLVLSAKEARASAGRADFQVAILDSDLSDESYVSLSYELLNVLPHLRLVVIPPDNNPNHPSLGGLIPHGYLNRPFYLPDLLELISRLVTSKEDAITAPSTVAGAIPDWLADVDILRDYLKQEMSGCDAIAAMVGFQGSLHARTGKLNDAASQEMASILLRYWNPGEKTDLMRFIRLSSTKGDYLVYATEIISNLVLIMVFEPGAQLSQIRPQTKQIAQHLAAHPPGAAAKPTPTRPPSASSILTPSLVGSKNGSDNNRAFDIKASPTAKPATLEPETERVEDEGLYSLDGRSFIPPSAPYSAEHKDESETGLPDQDNSFNEREIDISLLLGAIPSPDPDNSTPDPAPGGGQNFNTFQGWFPETNTWSSSAVPAQAGANKEPESSSTIVTNPNNPAHAASPTEVMPRASANEPFSAQAAPEIPSDSGNQLQTMRSYLLDPEEPEVDPLSDTRPHIVSTISQLSQMEAVSPALSLLNYTCVLLPRLPQHYLTGDLADKMAQWIQQLCIAFGWRLEGISLRPEYLQWTVQVAPSVSPGNLVRIIRQRTSIHVFNTYDHLRQQNPSGDFWATGYLIVSGPQPPSAQLLRDYIAQTRKRQGISKV